MSDVFVSVWAQTDVGMQRAGNEDSFLVMDLSSGNSGVGTATSSHQLGHRGSLLVVSDGMGGAAAGEIASEMAVATLRELLAADSGEAEVSDRLRRATEAANDRIWDHAKNNPELSGMGATVTAALVVEHAAYIAQVGDSRAYLVRGERIKQLTKDQSLAQMLVDFGAIKPEQINSVPQNVIMQALGTQPDVKVDMTAVQLKANDCLLICSDGLSNKVSPEEMINALKQSSDLSETCRKLVERANERGGEDNITVVVARFTGNGLDATGSDGSITSSLRRIGPDFFAEKLVEVAMASGAEAAESPRSTQEKTPAPPTRDGEIDEPSKDDPLGEEATLPPGSPGEYVIPTNTAEAPPVQNPDEQVALQDDIQIERIRKLRRKSYLLVWVVALISLLLIGATSYFFYNLYLKPKPSTPDAEPTQVERRGHTGSVLVARPD